MLLSSGLLLTTSTYQPYRTYFRSNNLGAMRLGDDGNSRNWACVMSCPPVSVPEGWRVDAAVLEVQTDLTQPDATVGNHPFSDSWSADGRARVVCDLVRPARGDGRPEGSDTRLTCWCGCCC